MRNRVIKSIVCGLFLAGVVSAEEATNKTGVVEDASTTNQLVIVDNSGATNKAEAVEAMTVEDPKKVAEKVEEAEAKEVAAMAQEKKIEELAKTPAHIDPWEAFQPPADSQFDWLQLTSGEWLKGDFKVLYDYTLEFDSDELDLLEFDFEDVKQLRTRGMKSVFVEGEKGRRDTSTLRGVLEIKDDEIVLRRKEYEVKIPRDRVISIASGQQRERDYWSGMLSFGATVRGGNTETTDITTIANLKRRTAATRFNADYLSNYSQNGEGGETVNNQRLNGYYDRFMSSKFYWQVLSAEYYRDPFSNIDSQYSLSMGGGLDILHTPKIEWTFTTGAGYQNQQFVSVEAGANDSSSSPFLTAGTFYDLEVNGRVDYLFDYSLRWLNEANGQYTHHMISTISVDLIKDFDLDVSFVWDRIEKPQPKDDGTGTGGTTTPKQDDCQLIVSLAYDF